MDKSSNNIPPLSVPPLRGVAVQPPRLDLVQRHLEKVVDSAEMRRSKKLCQFLRFTVEEVLRGHGSELKEYAIGVGVFRRGREFDTSADPIVRVQARRLRSKLKQYYLAEGRDEQIRIEYPVGSYSPIFLPRTPQPARAMLSGPSIQARPITPSRLIAVLPFVGLGVEGEAFSEGLTDELIHELSSRDGTRVVARSSCFQYKGRSEDVRRIGEALGAGSLVSGSVRIEGSRLRVLAQLVDVESGVNLWSYAYDRELGGILATQQEISRDVAGIVTLQFTKPDTPGESATTP